MKFKVSGSDRQGNERHMTVDADDEARAAQAARAHGIYPHAVQPAGDRPYKPKSRSEPDPRSDPQVVFAHDQQEATQAEAKRIAERMSFLSSRELLAIAALLVLLGVAWWWRQPGSTNSPAASALNRLRGTFGDDPPAEPPPLEEYARELERVSANSGYSIPELEAGVERARRDGIPGTATELINVARRTLDGQRQRSLPSKH